MNASIIDPLQGDFPEVIEEFLEYGTMKCIAFNRRGTLLAAGCTDGSCIIWDFETRGVAKELRDKDCVSAITSVCWSKYGHLLLVSSTDKSLNLWDVVKGERITRIVLEQTALLARLHPGSSNPTVCLACPFSSAPMIVDLNTGTTTVLPVSLTETAVVSAPTSATARNKFSDGSAPYTPTAACFSKHGDLVYVGNSKGEILIIDYSNVEICAVVPISGGSVIKNILFSRNGKYLLTNSNDRMIRIYENLLPLKEGRKALDELKEDDLKAVGAKSLSLFRELQDSITRIHWKAPCFSGDGEWLIGGSANKGEHKIYIWDRAGHLVKILEGPKEALIDLAWHPVHPIVVSVSFNGLVYIWAKDYTENWSAFAPDFKELEENEEYVEREDEFDLIPDTEKVKEVDVDVDEDVDIITVEKDSTFSDSDFEDEIRYLPVSPIPDIPEQPDKCVDSSSKAVESHHSASPLSEEAFQNGRASNNPEWPVLKENSAVEYANGTLSKRKRKPSEKVLELQAEKVKKPSRLKPSTKMSKAKPRFLVDQETSNSDANS
ncbi:protein RBL-like isoform X2 [Impatiens glandulifera]|uniref:protein RBL-like isoform X2 n=1 Tax=Impatiens glandulifera TaxID=253017 RepID=UPI001FB0D6AB|nr:protein RBL-like isoform X2 [Impatiens glandulifera]